MAQPRKPTALHLIDGTFRADRHKEQLANEPVATGRPIKPKTLRGRASTIWDEYIERAPWLGEADTHALLAFCCLEAELERAPTKFVASRYSQLRSYGIRLGLDPSARASLGARAPKPNDGPKKKTPASRYFGKPAD